MNETFVSSKGNGKRKTPRDVDRFIDISGPDFSGRTKAHVILRHFAQFSDGTSMDVQKMMIDKPIVNIFSRAAWKNVYLDFGSSDDMDLRLMWTLLKNYSESANSVSYTEEELQRGYYDAGFGDDRMVYFPTLELILSPIGRETEYQICCYNPAFYTLSPNSLKGEACVLQFTFSEDWVTVVNEIEPIDHKKIYHEAINELKLEQE